MNFDSVQCLLHIIFFFCFFSAHILSVVFNFVKVIFIWPSASCWAFYTYISVQFSKIYNEKKKKKKENERTKWWHIFYTYSSCLAFVPSIFLFFIVFSLSLSLIHRDSHTQAYTFRLFIHSVNRFGLFYVATLCFVSFLVMCVCVLLVYIVRAYNANRHTKNIEKMYKRIHAHIYIERDRE